ncbi:MAG TPA: DUF6020 family protein, partial [Bacilli bacterium]|nr:DUF6020 family protein [Bacilli bacterium]
FLTIVLFKIYNDYYSKKNKSNGWYIFLSILFSIFLTIGYSYNKIDSWNLCFKSFPFIVITIIKIFSFSFLINMILNYAEQFIMKKKDIKISDKLKKLFEEKPFLFSVIVMIICWLPYIIAFYPAILSPDPSHQIKQFFGIETKYMDYTIQYENPSTITNHHPVLHTVLLGGCVKIGHVLFDSTNIGLFLYSIIQIIILVSTLAFTIKYMKTLKTPLYLRLMTLIVYSLVPVFPLYGMSAVKDVIFTSLVILYMISIYHLIKNNKENISCKNIILLIILMILIMLMRNNGIYLIVMSFPFLLIVNKNRLKLLIILVIPVVLYSSYNNYLLPCLRISQGSVREMLSIPFQQTARYVKEDYDNLDKDEIKAIDKVLDIETLAERYKPEISDPVKNEFNKYTTDKELKEYFRVWLKGLFKRPDIYVQATINNIYGYLTPDTANWYVYTNYDKRLSEESIFNYRFNKLSILRNTLEGYALSYPYLPLIGLLVNIGFNVWCYMFMFVTLLKRKQYKYLIYITPVISLVLVCFASPVNTYFRYAMPYVFALPIMLAIFKNIISEKSDNNE